jgi:hypothetical protein
MSVTVAQLEELAKQIADLRVKEAEMSAEKKKITAELEAREKFMIETLNQEGLTMFKSSVGTLSLSHRSSVKTPKDPDSRAAFFAYLKEKGIYDQMITVNSMTLNALYAKELDAAIARGEDDFQIPGISEVTLNEILSFRRN